MAGLRRTFLIDGWDLRSAAVRIETADGTLDAPDPVGDTVAVEGLDGEWDPYGGPGQPRRPDGPSTLTLTLSLMGVDPVTGQITGGSSQYHWFALWDDLVRRLFRRRLTVDDPGPGGTRRATARILPGSMKPSREPTSPWFGRCKAVLGIAAGHWHDLNPVSTGVQQLANNGVLDLSVFAAATAPCTELLVRIGPRASTILAPRLTTAVGYLGWTGSIPAGRQLEFDTATGLIGPGTGPAWAGAAVGTVEEWSPGPRLLEVDPSEPLSAVLTHAGAGTVPVEVVGRRRYRTCGGAGPITAPAVGYGVGGYGEQPYGE